MWSAFMNGSGLHGGGGAGGGYVPSQGWEFVPCSRMDRAERGRGKSRSPSRRISSPPTVFSHIYDTQFGASPGGGEGGAGTRLELLRGQMWPGPEHHQQQQQTQHTRLKKKFEDLKKRHVQDKEEWMREKESLLREVADIQGGENRRILLDLKTVLEEVQAEVKREEEKRSELQLQYTRDRCAWELEKAELQSRIAQLEVREGAGSVSTGVHLAAGPGSVASRSAREQHGETSTLRREREEQRRLLEDTHSTAMDLRCRLEHNERDWLREKAELLERFDVERREWECQLKDMQRKIEELYCDVRTKREGTGLHTEKQEEDAVAHRLSIRSTSTGSSLLSDNEPLSSSSQSEPITHPALPGFGLNRHISGSGCASRDHRQPACFQADSLFEFDVGGQFTQNDHSQPELVEELRSRGTWQQDSVTGSKEAVDTIELDTLCHGALGCGESQKNVSQDSDKNVGAEERPFWAELSYGSDKKKNNTALNAALKEIARISEELCSYQDEIRKKSGDKRSRSESLCLPEESEMPLAHDKIRLEVDEAPCDLSQIYDDLRALGKENWITLSPDNTWRADRGQSKAWRADSADPDSYRETQTCPGVLSEIDTAGPPIPPRTSSWNLSSPTHPDTELHIPETPVTTVRKCHSPCVLVDRKCGSPSIVRKFEAMLQENEGKVLIDGVVASCSVPANDKCNIGCCHSRWSCDASKFTNSTLSTYGTVQKSFSEVNILTVGKDMHSNYCPGVGNLKISELQIPQTVKELPLDLLLSSLEIPPASPHLQGSKRNIMLEQKTAEFNRTLFQAEMGRGVEEHDSFTVTDAGSVGRQPVLSATCALDEISPPRETKLQPHCTDVTTSIMGVHTSDSTIHYPEVQPRGLRCGPEGQEVRMKQEIPSHLSSEQPQLGVREAATITSHSPARHSEVKHKVQTASSPSRKTQRRADTEPLFTEPVLPANTQPGWSVDTSSSKNESPHGAKPQPARAAVSLQQLSAENKQRQMTQPGHQANSRHVSALPSQSDSSRPGPRIMNDHPWKALTLAAYPRPEGSRSNYGAVERILKNYESAARAQQNQSQPKETAASPNVSVRQEGNVTQLDMLDMDPLPLSPSLRHTQTSHTSQTHTTHAQLSSQCAMGVKEVHLTVQGQEDFRWNT
ncbi:protein SOGA3a isoform X2 [Plectropomus leopardus]|uniref:protein SOGA3a isoform X2 n=1 Tax=Plectropomus leopardus TaxID=160734 RepID=UPI001C4CB380|nr:protein SOGA3a isoform X2 [Plectropomus leopardus]